MSYGYARVSTDVQSLDAQVDEYNRAQVFTLVFRPGAFRAGRMEATPFLRLIKSPEMPRGMLRCHRMF